MSFFLRRGVMSSAALSGGTIYSASTANLTPASSHYLSAGNNFNIGSGEFGFSFWFKLDTITAATNCLFGKYNTGAGNASYYFRYRDDNKTLVLEVSTNGGSTTNSYAFSQTITASTWYHCVVTRVSNTIYLYIDGSEVSNQTMNVTAHTNTVSFDWGGLGALGSLFIDGSIYGGAVVTGDHFDSTDVSNLYGAGKDQITCYENLATATKNTIDSYWRMGNYNTNSGSELTDLAGAINLTNPNSAPFTGSGLSVEC